MCTGNGYAFLVGRVSYAFDLHGEFPVLFWKESAIFGDLIASATDVSRLVSAVPLLLSAGPCISTDTVCSSSLVAVNLAHKGLLNHETVAALAAGVNALLAPTTTVAICQLQVGIGSHGCICMRASDLVAIID